MIVQGGDQVAARRDLPGFDFLDDRFAKFRVVQMFVPVIIKPLAPSLGDLLFPPVGQLEQHLTIGIPRIRPAKGHVCEILHRSEVKRPLSLWNRGAGIVAARLVTDQHHAVVLPVW
ncbi:MAG: hypothetical protein MUE83_15845, partial [Tabrizicola sp.]|nr:hypothetical protein [Tabrizicola sp.]